MLLCSAPCVSAEIEFALTKAGLHGFSLLRLLSWPTALGSGSSAYVSNALINIWLARALASINKDIQFTSSQRSFRALRRRDVGQTGEHRER